MRSISMKFIITNTEMITQKTMNIVRAHGYSIITSLMCSCQLSHGIIWHRVNEGKSSRLKQILEHDGSHDPKHHEQSPCDK